MMLLPPFPGVVREHEKNRWRREAVESALRSLRSMRVEQAYSKLGWRASSLSIPPVSGPSDMI